MNDLVTFGPAWKSEEHTAEECIALIGFDPHAGHRDAEGRAIPQPPGPLMRITKVDHVSKTITVDFADD